MLRTTGAETYFRFLSLLQFSCRDLQLLPCYTAALLSYNGYVEIYASSKTKRLKVGRAFLPNFVNFLSKKTLEAFYLLLGKDFSQDFLREIVCGSQKIKVKLWNKTILSYDAFSVYQFIC